MATNDSEVTSEDLNRSFASMATLESLNYSFQGMLSVTAILLVLVIGTAFGNFLVGLSLIKYRSLHTVSNYLIGNLAASDFLLAITVLPLSTLDESLGRWILGRTMCNLWLVADVMYCTASIWNILVIALDRYTATMFPLWYRERRSPKQAAVYVAMVWLVAVATCVPPLLGWNNLSQNYIYANATRSFHCVLFQSPSYVMYSACFSFYAPFLLTFFLYLRIFFVLRKRLRRMRRATETHTSAAKRPVSSAAVTIRPTILLPSGQEMTSQMAPPGGGGGCRHVDDSTSKSPLTSDSEDIEGLESCTVTTIYSPSSPISLVHLPPNPLPPASSSGLTLPCGGSHNGFEDFRAAGGLGVPPPRALELTGRSRSTMDFLSPAVCTYDQRWKARSCHLDSEQARLSPSTKRPPVRRAHRNGSPRPRSTIPRRTGGPKLGSRRAGRYERREMRATVRMAIIIGVFCGMWIGFFTIYVYKGLCLDCYVPRSLEAFFFWLGYSNSAVNPVLYTIFNEEFRKAFQKILGCSKRNNSKTTKQ